MSLAATAWVPMGAQVPALSPNDHQMITQTLPQATEGFQKEVDCLLVDCSWKQGSCWAMCVNGQPPVVRPNGNCGNRLFCWGSVGMGVVCPEVRTLPHPCIGWGLSLHCSYAVRNYINKTADRNPLAHTCQCLLKVPLKPSPWLHPPLPRPTPQELSQVSAAAEQGEGPAVRS